MRSVRELPIDRPILVRDFGLTAEHLVVFDLPVCFDEETMFEGEPLPHRWTAMARRVSVLCPGQAIRL